jgi:hypothetical protein
LRHVNLKIPAYYGYLKGFDSFMQRAKSPGEPADFVLINQPVEGAIWKNERFSLLELTGQAKLIGVQGADGSEQVNGRPFVWLSNKASRFLIVSRIAQTANFSAWECLTGPGHPENKDRQIRISIGSDFWQKDLSGTFSIRVPLQPGLNHLDISCQDPPVTRSEDAPGALPLGLWGYQISAKETN